LHTIFDGDIDEDWYPLWYLISPTGNVKYKFLGPDPTDPGADPRVVDDVWLARVMWKMWELGMQPIVQGRDPEHYPNFICSVQDLTITSTERAESATLALLLSAKSANVEELVDILAEPCDTSYAPNESD
jgi:hypothetical protein